MKNLKDLVKFNRYKSVESFNNATDVTSSTISIVKLDEKVMDIYLGRTQLTHSNFPEVSVELRNMIDSLGNKLNELKTEFNSKLTSVDEKYDKKISKYIAEFESGIIDLVNYTDELSKEIFEIKTDVQNKHIDNNKQITNINQSISDINAAILKQNIFADELSNKIGEISAKQDTFANNIGTLKQDVAALKSEDTHIIELITDTQSKIKNVSNAVDISNDSLNLLSDKLTSIEDVSSNIAINVKNLKDRLNKINTDLYSDIKTNVNDISAIKLDILDLSNIVSNIKVESVNLEPIKQNIIDLSNTIDVIKNKLTGIDDNKSRINNIASKQDFQSKDISDIKRDIASLHVEDNHIFEILNDIQTTLSKLTNDSSDISIDVLVDKLSKLENVDSNLNSDIANLKKRVEGIKNDILKSVVINKNNISNIEVKIEDIYNKISKINGSGDIDNIVDLEPIKQDIVNLSNTINNIKSKLSVIDDNKSRINNITLKQDSQSKDISDIKNDIAALHVEDNHIFDILDDIQTTLSKLTNDNDDISIDVLVDKLSKLENADSNLNNNIINLKERVDAIKSDISKSVGINKNNISNIEVKIEDIYNKISKINTNTNLGENVDLEPIKNDIDSLTKSIADIKIAINNHKQNIAKLESDHISSINEIQNVKLDIAALKNEDYHILTTISNIQNKLDSITNDDGAVNIDGLKNDIAAISKDNEALKNSVIGISNNISNINTALSKRLNITESDISLIKNNILELENAINDINKENVDITPIISDISIIKQNINDVSKDLLKKIEENLSKINKLNSKDIEFANDIFELKNDILSLHVEDTHIFSILNELQSLYKTIASDSKYLKENNEKINDEIISIKEKIEYLSGVNIDSFETLEGINRRLNKLESTDEEFKKTIDELNETIKDSANTQLKWIVL